MTLLLKISQLKTYFYTLEGVVKAVDGVSLTVKKKEVVGLVGESGCGKSTTALSVVRLVPPPGRIVEGEIVFDGVRLLDLPEDKMREIRGKGISMVFQDPLTFLNPVMKVKDQIAEVIIRHSGSTRKDAYAKAIHLLEQVKIASPRQVADYYPHQLSGGMCQRVVISIALACKPKLIMADEPTTALDATIQREIIRLMHQLISNLDMSLLIITHNLALVAEICDRILIMYAGKIVESADIYTLFENPIHPYSELLLKCVPRPDKTTAITYIPGTVPDLMNPPAGCRFHPRCPYAIEKCSRVEPSLEERFGHFFACWVR